MVDSVWKLFLKDMARNYLKLDFQGLKNLKVIQLLLRILPSHKYFKEYVSPFVKNLSLSDIYD